MSELIIEHNLDDEELQKAIVSLVKETGLSDEIEKSLKAEKTCQPREPRHPAMRELYRQFKSLYGESTQWAINYIDGILSIKANRSLEKAVKLDRPLTSDEIGRIQQAIRDRFGFISAQMQSIDFQPSPEVLKRWKELGFLDKNVTAKAFAVAIPAKKKLVQNAFLFGRLYQAVEKGKSFDDVLKLALDMPLTKPDTYAIAVAEQQTGNYISALGDGLSKEFGQMAVTRNREVIRKMAIEYHGHELTREDGKLVDTWQGFSQQLANKFQDHERDWDRIAFSELRDAQGQGQAMGLLEDFGPEQLVYKMPLATACAQCIYLYTNPDGKPKLFKIGEMLRYGNNIGRKPYPVRGGVVDLDRRLDGADTLKPVAGQVHPWCECSGPYAYTGYEHWAEQE
ncbi:hypothetical protein KAR91_36945 [Candidatus Pacearchaeota archaeon]|nr:hypothetical protein [Candidatus Pacearchaeota archaeon]